MAKKVLILSTSLRSGSNSEILAHECERGAKDAGCEVTFLSLKGKNIRPCIGCLTCQKTGTCVIKDDDAAEIREQIRNAEVLVFATPIYYYEMSGQMKTMLDRMNPLFPSEYAFRDVYMIATAADAGEKTFTRAYSGLSGWTDCFPKCRLSGLVFGDAIGDPGEAGRHEDAMQKAYELGKKL